MSNYWAIGPLENRNWMKINGGVLLLKPVAFDVPSRDVLARDIADSLNAQKRCLGRMPWTVAQHSLAVAAYLAAKGHTTETVLYGLLHDAHEAYIGDIPYPVGQSLCTDAQYDIDLLKEEVDRAIWHTLCITAHREKAKMEAVEDADKLAFTTEWSRFLVADSSVREPLPASKDLLKATVTPQKVTDVALFNEAIDFAGKLDFRVELWRLLRTLEARNA